MKAVATILTVLLTLLLLASAYLGLTGGFALVRESHSAWQAAATATELGYGVAGLLAIVLRAAQHRWSLAVLVVWVAGLVATSALAPVVWGHASRLVGVGSGAGALVLMGGLVWGWRAAGARAGR